MIAPKPSTSAHIVYKNDAIQIYSDGTWLPLKPGWHIHPDARIYAGGAQNTGIKMKTVDRYKLSHMTDDQGRVYDTWAIAAGTVQGP